MILCRKGWSPAVFAVMAVCSSWSIAEPQAWGRVARSDEAFHLARGQIGGGEDAAVSHPSADGEPELVLAEAAVQPSTAEGGQGPSGRLEKPEAPFASRLARGDMVERDEPVLAGNLPLKLGVGLGAVLLSSALDKSGERFGRDHGDKGLAKGVARLGNALPLVALGAAGLAALDGDDPRLGRTGLAALEAGGGAVLTSLGLKYVVGRSRPEADAGPGDFHPLRATNGDSSMPSIHTAAVWGAVTPFAKEYDMPWLYGVAALTNYARVAERKHWVSDTVAGSVLGYLAGDIAWRWNRSGAGVGSQVYVGPASVGVSWPLR